jgi:hypothetical protein
VTPPTVAEQHDSLAAMIGTVAEGNPATDLDRALLRLDLVRAAQDKGLSWAAIGTALGYPSGRQAKKAVHDLKARVQRELRARESGTLPPGPARMPKRGATPPPRTLTVLEDGELFGWVDELAQFRRGEAGPYVHEHAAPEPGERYVPYTMTGPGVVAAED